MEEVEACKLIHPKPKEHVIKWKPARELDIYLIKDKRCWRWIQIDRTEVAELLEVHTLDIKGFLDAKQLDIKTLYSAYIVFKLRESSHGLEHLKASVNGKPWHPVVFVPRPDGWIEIKLGEFFPKCGEVEMRLYDTVQDYSKSGLLVKGIEVRSI